MDENTSEHAEEAYFIAHFGRSGSIGNWHAMQAQLPLVELKVALRGDVDSTGARMDQ